MMHIISIHNPRAPIEHMRSLASPRQSCGLNLNHGSSVLECSLLKDFRKGHARPVLMRAVVDASLTIETPT